MKKKIAIGFIVVCLLTIGLFSILPSPLPKNYGGVDYEIFLTEQKGKRPMVVGFGGSEGGMIYSTKESKSFRDRLNQYGYHFLSIGYFGTEHSPTELDRISLDAIYDTIKSVSQNPNIDENRITIIGGSRGGELVLNLACRYNDIDAVIAIVPANVSTYSTNMRAGPWSFYGETVPYVPFTIKSVYYANKREFLKMYRAMFKHEETVNKATIPVEQINCPILIISANRDQAWPSTTMSNKIVERLDKHNFEHFYEHIELDGGHHEPGKRLELIYNFLKEHFPSENITPDVN